MVQTKVRSIDGDGHVIEDTRRLLEHMEAPYHGWYAVSRTGQPSLVPSDGAPRGLGGKFRGGSWVPWWLDRMDEEYEHRGAEEAPDLKHKPSELVHAGGNIFFGCEAEERLLGPTLDLIGSATVMYASDWPHWDGDYPHSLFEMQHRKDLNEEQRHGVLCRAAERFYGLR